MEPTLHNHETLERLLLYLEDQDYGFVIVEVNEYILEKQAVEYITEHLSAKKCVTVDLLNLSAEKPPLTVIREKCKESSDDSVFLLLNFHKAVPDGKEKQISLIRDLNYDREAYSALQRLLVFFLPVYIVDMIIRHAKDFFDFVPVLFTLVPEAAQAPEREIERQEPVDRIFLENRIAFLENTLAKEELEDKEKADTLFELADCNEQLNHYERASDLFEKSLSLYTELDNKTKQAEIFNQIGRIYRIHGKINEAFKLHQNALKIYEELGYRRSRAVTLGDLARILVSKGEVEEALKLHQEELKVYEELGDRRERAVTLGDLARILVSKGEVEEALKLQNQRLETNKELGDLDGIGAALFDIAQIELQQHSFQEAYNHLSESYAIFNRIGRLDFLCYVGMYLGHLLCQADQKDEGIRILKRSEEGFLRLGWDDQARQVEEIIRQAER